MKKKIVQCLIAVCAVTLLCGGCVKTDPDASKNTQTQDEMTETAGDDGNKDDSGNHGSSDNGEDDTQQEAGNGNEVSDNKDKPSPNGGSKDEELAKGVIQLEEGKGQTLGDSDKVLTVYSEKVDEYDDYALYISYGDDTLQITEYCYGLESAYALVEYTNSFYVLVGALHDNDWCELHLMKVDNTGIEWCDSIGAHYANGAPDSVNSFQLLSKIDVLGTYSGKKTYSIRDDAFYTTDKFYTIDNGPQVEYPRELVSTKEFPVELDGKQTMLPKGSTIYIVGTDYNGIVQFVTEDGTNGIIHYSPRTETSWELTIDGISEEELFEMLPYAG